MGAMLTIASIDSIAGTVTVQPDGSPELVLGMNLAARIDVVEVQV